MSDGLDVLQVSPDGHIGGEHISLVASFASISVAKELESGAYPLLNSVWGYQDTTIQAEDVANIIREAEALLRSGKRLDSQIVEEIRTLIRFASDALQSKRGLIFSGP